MANIDVWENKDIFSTVFIPTRSLPTFDKPIYGLDIVRATDSTTGMIGAIECVQKFHGIWRVTVKNDIARALLLTRGISLRGHYVAVLGQNPFLTPDGEEPQRLSISNIPYGFSIEPILQALDDLGVKLTSNLKPEYFREDNNKLIEVKTGKLFAYMSPPKEPLPRFVQLTRRHKVYLSYLGQEEELEKIQNLEKAKEQATQQEKEKANDQPHTHTPSVPSCTAETGLTEDTNCADDIGRIEDTAEPLPYSDHPKENSLSASATFIKPVAFDISLSSIQERILNKKKNKNKALEKDQLTLVDMVSNRSKTPSRAPREDRSTSSSFTTKRNFSQRNSPNQDTLSSQAKASKTVIDDAVYSRSLRSASFSAPSEGLG